MEFLVAFLVFAGLLSARYWKSRTALPPNGGRASAPSAEGVATAKQVVVRPPFWGPLLIALTGWALFPLAGVVLLSYLFVPKVVDTLNPLLFSIIFWMLYVLVRTGAWIAKKRSMSNPKLGEAREWLRGLAVLSSVITVVYYWHFAPAGAWTKLEGGRSGITGIFAPHVPIPKGISRNPKFTSTQLANWNVHLRASNPQYDTPQSRWHGMKLGLALVNFMGKPGREVTDVVNLTTTFTDEKGVRYPKYDLNFSGSCYAVMIAGSDISKSCGGGWKDRGGQISGQFCLGVTEVGTTRYFDIKLFDGNALPVDCIDKRTFWKFWGRIPHLELQFRPNEWKEES